MLYTVQDTTMTALGDAVRKQTTKYKDSDSSNPLYFWMKDIDSTTFDYSEWELNDNAYHEENWIYTKKEKLNIFDDVDLEVYDGAVMMFKYQYKTNKTGLAPLIGIRWYSNPDGSGGYHETPFISSNSQNTVLEYVNEARIDFPVYYINQGYYPYFVIERNKRGIMAEQTFTCQIEAYPYNKNTSKYISINTMTPAEMVDEIGGLSVFPEDKFLLTGNLINRFAKSYGWDWALEKYIDKWHTENVSSLNSTFYEHYDLENIPFEINGNYTVSLDQTFYQCQKLKQIPILNLPTVSNLRYTFTNCYNLREITDEQWNVENYYMATYDGWGWVFQNCYSLRRFPTKLLNNLWNTYASAYATAYRETFIQCYCLDEINGLGVSTATYTSNMFSATFNQCARLKDFTFAVNEDGTSKTANWKNQVIDLSYYLGYGNTESYILNYNSGITVDKKVYDDATYQALKDDPDWYSLDINYSRYNHDSAVNTINSLPDCSSSGGTNTIKFNGAAGALTDGGAINTLTEEEIAVATAKGWTVSLV